MKPPTWRILSKNWLCKVSSNTCKATQYAQNLPAEKAGSNQQVPEAIELLQMKVERVIRSVVLRDYLNCHLQQLQQPHHIPHLLQHNYKFWGKNLF